jgi:hypothetical protein
VCHGRIAEWKLSKTVIVKKLFHFRATLTCPIFFIYCYLHVPSFLGALQRIQGLSFTTTTSLFKSWFHIGCPTATTVHKSTDDLPTVILTDGRVGVYGFGTID